MKFAVQSTVLAAFFFTFVFATPTKEKPATPSVPPTKIECSTQKTCDECIAVKGTSGSPVCGYSPTNNACVELSSTSSAGPSSLKLIHTTTDCKPISSQQSSQHTPDASETTNAAQNTKTQEGGSEQPAGDTTVAAQHKSPPSTVTCGANTYSRTHIQAAIKDGRARIKKPIGPSRSLRGKYPHRFGNIENLNMGSCARKPYYEFPILTQGPYQGRRPGADRVIFKSNGNYCALITHTGAATKGGFVSCT